MAGRGKASRPEDLSSTKAGEPYRPRHAADATEPTLDRSEAPADPRTGRHRADQRHQTLVL
jgi:hypothetical protein